jgi:hypothetical protein
MNSDLQVNYFTLLPLNPYTYYGLSVAVENLKLGTKVYFGHNNTLTLEIVRSIIKNDSNLFEILTDDGAYLALRNTRLQYCSS